jgi:hypothetical protein
MICPRCHINMTVDKDGIVRSTCWCDDWIKSNAFKMYITYINRYIGTEESSSMEMATKIVQMWCNGEMS